VTLAFDLIGAGLLLAALASCVRDAAACAARGWP